MATPAEYMFNESGEVVSAAELEQQQLEAREMRDEMLVSAIREREDMSYGDDVDSLQQDRAKALDAYLGRGYGNEIEGRSQIVSKDLYDTVESILPVMQRIFASGDNICEFSPEGAEDVDGAEQESDYTNYVIQRKNPWFMLAYTWFKDALITKNAYAYACWKQENDMSLERYEGLTTDQMVLLANDPEVEIVGHNQRQVQAPVPNQIALAAMAQGIAQAFPAMTVHDVELRRRKAYGCTKIHILPPERCLVAHDTNTMSVRDSDFFEYWEDKSISSLRVDGFEIEDDIADSDTHTVNDTVIDQSRDYGMTTTWQQSDSVKGDPSMRKVRCRYVWIRNDYDGDGIAELRYVVLVGTNILANEEVPCMPVASIVPIPMPHRHIGLSMYDAVEDLQKINTMMLRGGIDNQFLLNNTRVGVDKNRVNLDDLQVSRPGGIVRTDGPPSQSILPFQQPDTVQSSLRMLEYVGSIRENRAGVQKPMAGADMDAIMAQPGTIAQLTSAASQKMELIARIFAEGVKELFQIVHEVTLTHATMPDKVQLRNQWVTVDPRQWKKRQDMTIAVGMGVGNKQSHAAGISALIGMQQKAAGIGLTDMNKIYAGYSEFTKALGFGNAAQFFTEPPPGTQLPQPPPPYQIMVEQMRGAVLKEVEAYKGQVDVIVEQIKTGESAQETRFKEFMQLLNDREERMLRAFSEATERAQELRLAQAQNSGLSIKADLAGMGDMKKALEEALGMGSQTMEQLNVLQGRLGDMEKAATKKRRKKVTAPSGKTYTVEDTD